MTQAEGVISTFLCQCPQADGNSWIINGTPLLLLNPEPEGIVPGLIALSDGMGGSITTYVLNITAFSSYRIVQRSGVLLL